MKNTEVNFEALFDEIVEQGREEGIETEQAFHDLVEEVVMENSENEGWYEEQDVSEAMEQLRSKWGQYQEAIGLTTNQDEIEQ